MELDSDCSPHTRTATGHVDAGKRKRQRGFDDDGHPAEKKPQSYTAYTEGKGAAVDRASREEINPIDHWTKERSWPRQYFEQDDQTREDFNEYFNEDFDQDFEKDSRSEKGRVPNMSRPLPKKKSASSRHVQSESGSATSSSITTSDQKPRQGKSAPYKEMHYQSLLAAKGSFMYTDERGIKDESKNLCRTLLESDQTTPRDSLFRDDLFEAFCLKLEARNEAMIIQDITQLIVPSAQNLAIYGAKHLSILIETVNEGWDNSRPFVGTRPQPDYSVGFRREAFTVDQLDKLEGLVGEVLAGDMSFSMATYFMYFPFLTCEVKSGAAGLDIADRQNAHSMTLAVRGVVDLFRLVRRETEIDREILAISVSHDQRRVRIYGHYPVIMGNTIKFYRHTIHAFDITALEGKHKWTAYKFTKNVYDIWVPNHFKRLCSVIDQLPADRNLDIPPLSEGTGLSQVLESRHSSQSSPYSVSILQENDSQASSPGSQVTTSSTSLSPSAV